ncbi:MAG: hypothetical protein RM368_10400 [Nostoc sp. DedSLP03]|uniref:hypothetical protein n=1 Tax=Nostoc sp. DedSLP03 TaxID=3075400 RepID=UPI002AD294B3|nr:hypothetical protein [Nostoc sp. DedSLP03]MDZ7965371.1 hypothetical protein [Nostoc sp. DedSLP03]
MGIAPFSPNLTKSRSSRLLRSLQLPFSPILIFYRTRTNNSSMVLTEEWIATAISTIFTLGSRGGISAVEIFEIVN